MKLLSVLLLVCFSLNAFADQVYIDPAKYIDLKSEENFKEKMGKDLVLEAFLNGETVVSENKYPFVLSLSKFDFDRFNFETGEWEEDNTELNITKGANAQSLYENGVYSDCWYSKSVETSFFDSTENLVKYNTIYSDVDDDRNGLFKNEGCDQEIEFSYGYEFHPGLQGRGTAFKHPYFSKPIIDLNMLAHSLHRDSYFLPEIERPHYEFISAHQSVVNPEVFILIVKSFAHFFIAIEDHEESMYESKEEYNDYINERMHQNYGVLVLHFRKGHYAPISQVYFDNGIGLGVISVPNNAYQIQK